MDDCGYYEKALSVDPRDIETLYQLGISYLAQGNRAKATEMYGRLKKLDPGNAEMLRRLIR
jgi:cytochrome c-type biogenesis protein CcmH/NrfG